MTDTFDKDPNAELDFAFDWADWLEVGETITTAVVTVPAGITKDSDSHNGVKVTIWLSGGTTGTGYPVQCRVTTNLGRIDDRTMYIVCKEA